MWFILLFLVALAVLAYGLEWIIDQPGSLTLDWGEFHVDTSIPVAVGALVLTVAALMLLWAILSSVFGLPWRLRELSVGRRREKGFKALSRGMIAVGAGDAKAARQAAQEAEKHMPGEPLAQYLKAQAAQLEGDRGKAEAAFHKMTLFPDTKLLGLRGLHIEARRRDDAEAAHHFAKAAHDIAPLPWAGSAVLEHYTAQGEWEKARAAIEESFRAKAIDLPTAQRLRAVIETAMATEKQIESPQEALHLSRLALKRRPGFTPGRRRRRARSNPPRRHQAGVETDRKRLVEGAASRSRGGLSRRASRRIERANARSRQAASPTCSGRSGKLPRFGGGGAFGARIREGARGAGPADRVGPAANRAYLSADGGNRGRRVWSKRGRARMAGARFARPARSRMDRRRRPLENLGANLSENRASRRF